MVSESGGCTQVILSYFLVLEYSLQMVCTDYYYLHSLQPLLLMHFVMLCSLITVWLNRFDCCWRSYGFGLGTLNQVSCNWLISQFGWKHLPFTFFFFILTFMHTLSIPWGLFSTWKGLILLRWNVCLWFHRPTPVAWGGILRQSSIVQVLALWMDVRMLLTHCQPQHWAHIMVYSNYTPQCVYGRAWYAVVCIKKKEKNL